MPSESNSKTKAAKGGGYGFPGYRKSVGANLGHPTLLIFRVFF
jgi:hypothetical protein